MRLKYLLPLFFMAAFIAAALNPPAGALALDDDSDGVADRWEAISEEGGLAIYLDTKGDGQVDYVLEHDEEGYKAYEALDFNGDGELDDYYFYRKEILVKREIDSNYDGRVDVWVSLTEGVYISGYERDTDFDGVIDLVKSYGEAE